MLKLPGLVERESGFHVRKVVPSRLRKQIGSGEVRLSLKTKAPMEARKRYPAAMATLQARIDAAQATLDGTSILSKEQVQELARIWFIREEEKTLEKWNRERPAPDEIQEIDDQLSQDVSEWKDWGSPNTKGIVQREVAALLDEKDIIIPDNNASYKQLSSTNHSHAPQTGRVTTPASAPAI